MRMRRASLADSEHIATIYNHYVLTTIISFETHPISADEMMHRMQERLDNYPWLVIEKDNLLLGYAYGSPYRQRLAYRQTVETSIYLIPDATGRGLGTKLYSALLQILKTEGYHTALGIIALPNPRSVRLHEKLGFQQIAHLHEVGKKFGRWIDTGYWQKIL